MGFWQTNRDALESFRLSDARDRDDFAWSHGYQDSFAVLWAVACGTEVLGPDAIGPEVVGVG